jgi:hypothetical protein
MPVQTATLGSSSMITHFRRFVMANSASHTTVVATFPASLLKDGGGNVVELHSQGERSFGVLEAIVHFRQNT